MAKAPRPGETYAERAASTGRARSGESPQDLIDRTLHAYSFNVTVTRPDGRTEERTVCIGAYGETDDDADANFRRQTSAALGLEGTFARIYLLKPEK
jgi:hypothetical protein